jgi:hypothetical protein
VGRLLFLDYDGVLHPTSAVDADLFCRAELLLEALGGADCSIVISSSWRHHHPMRSLLARLPPRLAHRVVGATAEPHIGRWPRYHEIVSYAQGYAPAADWRALDDSLIEFPPGCPELIACHPNHGFGKEQFRALRGWLAQPSSSPRTNGP